MSRQRPEQPLGQLIEGLLVAVADGAERFEVELGQFHAVLQKGKAPLGA